MQEHFDEIKKHMQSPQLEDTEEDQTSGEKVEVPGDRIVSSRLDTSYINGAIEDYVFLPQICVIDLLIYIQIGLTQPFMSHCSKSPAAGLQLQ